MKTFARYGNYDNLELTTTKLGTYPATGYTLMQGNHLVCEFTHYHNNNLWVSSPNGYGGKTFYSLKALLDYFCN